MGAILFSENETPNFYVTLSDAATDQYPLAYVYNYDKTLKETVTLTHNANGMYIGTAASAYTHNTYSVVYKVFSDVGHTTLNQAYWVVEDILTIAYQPTWGNGGGGGNGNIIIDMKKFAEAVWDHPFPRKILKLLEFIKEAVVKIRGVVLKITDTKVIDAIKGIKFPAFPKPEKINLKPVLDAIAAIPEPEKMDMKPMMNCMAEIDYGNTLSQLVDSIEQLKGSVSEVDYGNTLSQLVAILEKDEKSDPNIMEKLEELKKLIKKL